jgi:hypothetical protein
LNLQGLTTLVAVVVGAVAIVLVRRLRSRLDRLTEVYWDLRYEYGQLRSRLDRLEDPARGGNGESSNVLQAESTSFVPLSSLKRSGSGGS